MNPVAEILKDWGNRLAGTKDPEELVARVMEFLGFADALKEYRDYLSDAAWRTLESAYALIDEVLRNNTYLAKLASTDKAKFARAAGMITAVAAVASIRFTIASGQRALAAEF